MKGLDFPYLVINRQGKNSSLRELMKLYYCFVLFISGCPQLMYVAGNHDYPHVEGLYLLQDDLQSGDLHPTHPVYRHACHANYLYYHLSHAAWWIGPELGALSGYALSYSGSGPNPSQSGEPWLYWSHLDREWYHDLGARTVCLSEFIFPIRYR